MDNGFHFVGVAVCDRIGADSLGRDPEGGGDGAGELSGKTGRVGGAERGLCGGAGEVWEELSGVGMSDENDTDRSVPDGAGEVSSTCSAVVHSIVDKAIRAGRDSVLASNQYGMGFILSCKNEILFRNDSLSDLMRKAIADEVNQILKQNSREHPTR